MLAQQACFLSLIQLEKDRNPHGTNDNHRYEDLREEIAKSGQQKIKKYKMELEMRLAPFTQCEANDTMKVTSNPELATINFKVTEDMGAARTGFIPCENGFTAEVRVITPKPGSTDWNKVLICLVTD